jgi:hypothetical protein
MGTLAGSAEEAAKRFLSWRRSNMGAFHERFKSRRGAASQADLDRRHAESGKRDTIDLANGLSRRCPGFQERRRKPFLEAVLPPPVQEWLYRSPWLVFSLSETIAVQVTVHKWRRFNSKD